MLKKQNCSQQPVIAALTGHTEAEFLSLAFQKGVDQVYSKPIRIEQVQMVLMQAGIHFKVRSEVASLLGNDED